MTATTMTIVAVIATILVAAIGFVLARLSAQLAESNARLDALREMRAEAEQSFTEATDRIVTQARDTLLTIAEERLRGTQSDAQGRIAEMVAPFHERLNSLAGSIDAMNRARAEETGRLNATIGALREQSAALAGAVSETKNATDRVANLLSSSTARGSWGEYELRRLVEAAGMTEHVSFDEQVRGYGAEGTGRPDMVIRLAGGATVPVDAKLPFDSYQAATEAKEDGERATLLKGAVAAVRTHIRTLSARRYHLTEASVGWTIMFVPIEAMLSTCLALDAGLLQNAIESRILIASPLTLMVYLHAFAWGWQLARQQENAEQILDETKTLVERLGPFIAHFNGVGDRLEAATKSYNSATASFEMRVAPQARKIAELGGGETIPETPQREAPVRRIDPLRLPLPSMDFEDR